METRAAGGGVYRGIGAWTAAAAFKREVVLRMPDESGTHAWWVEVGKGDSFATSKLLAAHYPALRAETLARMDPILRAKFEPEDILQQTFLEVFRSLPTFQDHGPRAFFNWVFTILERKLIDARRSLHRQIRDIARELPPVAAGNSQSYINLLDQLCVDSHTPSRAARQDEAVEMLLACLAQLSDAHRQVLTLRFLKAQPVEEVAETMHKSDAAVVALTKRALEALRESMERLGEFTRGG